MILKFLFAGHLCICRDLLAFMSAEKKYDVGSNPKTSVHLIKDLAEDFIFPASKMHVIYKNTSKIPMGAVIPVCNTGKFFLLANNRSFCHTWQESFAFKSYFSSPHYNCNTPK